MDCKSIKATRNVSLFFAFITARKRSLGQGNVFTPVCDSVHGVGCVSQHAMGRGVLHHPWADTHPSKQTPPPPRRQLKRAVPILLEFILVYCQFKRLRNTNRIIGEALNWERVFTWWPSCCKTETGTTANCHFNGRPNRVVLERIKSSFVSGRDGGSHRVLGCSSIFSRSLNNNKNRDSNLQMIRCFSCISQPESKLLHMSCSLNGSQISEPNKQESIPVGCVPPGCRTNPVVCCVWEGGCVLTPPRGPMYGVARGGTHTPPVRSHIWGMSGGARGGVVGPEILIPPDRMTDTCENITFPQLPTITVSKCKILQFYAEISFVCWTVFHHSCLEFLIWRTNEYLWAILLVIHVVLFSFIFCCGQTVNILFRKI